MDMVMHVGCGINEFIKILYWDCLSIRSRWRCICAQPTHEHIFDHYPNYIAVFVKETSTAKTTTALKANLNKTLGVVVRIGECLDDTNVSYERCVSLWDTRESNRTDLLANFWEA